MLSLEPFGFRLKPLSFYGFRLFGEMGWGEGAVTRWHPFRMRVLQLSIILQLVIFDYASRTIEFVLSVHPNLGATSSVGYFFLVAANFFLRAFSDFFLAFD